MGGPADRCGLAGRIGRVWDWDMALLPRKDLGDLGIWEMEL
jgi:hypothetical protein